MVAVVDPAGTRTDAGTIRAEAKLLERATVVPPVGAAWERVTLQVVEAEAARLVLPHCIDVICVTAATSERLAVMLAVFKLAVTDAA